MAAGQGLEAYNREQQGEIVADYFELRQQARQYETNGQIAPLSLRQNLDVYIHFVKRVSTLSAQQLDTPNPTLHVAQQLGNVLTTTIARAK
jgi:hypothetical protein